MNDAVERLRERMTPTVGSILRRLDPEENRAIIAHIDALTAKLAEAERERDEADRRAGAAERQLEHASDSIRARMRWLDQAKDDAGFDRNVSFDKVWAAALAAYKAAIEAGQHRGNG